MPAELPMKAVVLPTAKSGDQGAVASVPAVILGSTIPIPKQEFRRRQILAVHGHRMYFHLLLLQQYLGSCGYLFN